MKKILLITLSLLLISSLLVAHEFSAYYSSKRIDDGVGSERYWHLRNIYLDWAYKDFSTGLNITELTADPPKLNIDAAWIKFNLLTSYFSPMQRYQWFILDMQAGKMYYPFGNVSPYASENISIFQPPTFDNSWMLNMTGSYCSRYHFNLYWADEGKADGTLDYPSTIGTRATADIGDFKVGVSYKMENWNNEDGFDKYSDYGVDLTWCYDNLFKLNTQIYNLQDDDDDTSDLNYFVLASYKKGFMLPFFKKTIPYLGYFSKNDKVNGDGASESNIIVGLNMKPHKNIFMKFEYNYDSMDNNEPNVLSRHNLNTSNALSFEFGLVF